MTKLEEVALKLVHTYKVKIQPNNTLLVYSVFDRDLEHIAQTYNLKLTSIIELELEFRGTFELT